MASIALARPRSAALDVPRELIDHLGAILLASTLALSFNHDSFLSWQFAGWAVLFGLSWAYLGVEHRQLARRETVALGILLVSMALSIPGTLLWGNGLWLETLMVVLWTGPMAAFFVVKRPALVFWWLMPFLLLHAGVLFYEGFVLGELRAWGLTISPNPAAAALLLGALFALGQHRARFWWLAAPLLLALPYTGSRWTLVVALLCIGIMTLTRWGRWRSSVMAASLALSFGLAWLMHDGLLMDNFRLSPSVPEYVYRTTADIQYRMVGEDEGPGLTRGNSSLRLWLGQGYIKSVGLHNVPLRMAAQFGVLAALAWVYLVAKAWLKQPRTSPFWWLALAVLALSQMDYYLMMGQMAGLMWLILGSRYGTGNAGTD